MCSRGKAFLPFVMTLGATLILASHSQAQRGITGPELPSGADARTGRVALVIGNGAYQDVPLRNPVNDAKDMTKALHACGFDVIAQTDRGLPAMRTALDEFGRRTSTAGVALFFYAGHGVQVNGRNYLVPLGANMTAENEVEFECLDVGRVLAKMEDAGTLNILILDACRDNPFARSWRRSLGNQGLAAMAAPRGSFIALATAPGGVADDGAGRNGTFTASLLKYLPTPGASLDDLLTSISADVQRVTKGKQVPWRQSSLTGKFYFIPPTGSTSDTKVVTPPLPPLPPPPHTPRYSEKYISSVSWKKRKLDRRSNARLQYVPLEIEARFRDNGNGTVFDKHLNVEWQKTPPPDLMSFDAAQKRCASFSPDQKGGWRLPTVQELATLTCVQDGGRFLITQALEAHAGQTKYWTSEERRFGGTAWYVDHSNVTSMERGKSERCAVRAVRGVGGE